MALDVLLFTVDGALARRAAAAGLAGLVVDWEERGANGERAVGDDDAPDTSADLERMAAVTGLRVVCRINPVGPNTAQEIDAALAHGATDVLVPMVESPRDVACVARLVGGRARVGIMVETMAACDNADEIAREPVDFVYVGLLDLAICRREANVFRPFADGTADRLRDAFRATRFGIGGVTVVDGGAPVPCRALLGEMARLGTDVAFARRSFKRDAVHRDLGVEHERLQTAWDELLRRDQASVAADHCDFVTRFGGSWSR